MTPSSSKTWKKNKFPWLYAIKEPFSNKEGGSHPLVDSWNAKAVSLPHSLPLRMSSDNSTSNKVAKLTTLLTLTLDHFHPVWPFGLWFSSLISMTISNFLTSLTAKRSSHSFLSGPKFFQFPLRCWCNSKVYVCLRFLEIPHDPCDIPNTKSPVS